jgi:hypothetical protein
MGWKEKWPTGRSSQPRAGAQGDEWIAFPRRYLPEGGMDQLYPTKLPESTPALPNTTNAPAD